MARRIIQVVYAKTGRWLVARTILNRNAHPAINLNIFFCAIVTDNVCNYFSA